MTGRESQWGGKKPDWSRTLSNFSARTITVDGEPVISALQRKSSVIICKHRKFPPCKTCCSGGPRMRTDSPIWLNWASVTWPFQPPAWRARGFFLWLEIPSCDSGRAFILPTRCPCVFTRKPGSKNRSCVWTGLWWWWIGLQVHACVVFLPCLQYFFALMWEKYTV